MRQIGWIGQIGRRSCQVYLLSRTSGLLSMGAHLDILAVANLGNRVNPAGVAGVYPVWCG